MSTAESDVMSEKHVIELPLRRKLAPNGVLGMALFVFMEVMLFVGFISAFMIVKNSATGGLWPPPDQPRLPVTATAINTAALLLSGMSLFLSNRAFQRDARAVAGRLLGAAILLGGFFVVFQGVEWVGLLRQGMTLTSSQIGAFFYLIVGAHALHAVVALIALVVFWRAMQEGRLGESAFATAQVFWYFVVLMWPVIYIQVYL